MKTTQQVLEEINAKHEARLQRRKELIAGVPGSRTRSRDAKQANANKRLERRMQEIKMAQLKKMEQAGQGRGSPSNSKNSKNK